MTIADLKSADQNIIVKDNYSSFFNFDSLIQYLDFPPLFKKFSPITDTGFFPWAELRILLLHRDLHNIIPQLTV